MIAWRVSSIRLPVDRSITVSAPQRTARSSFSTSSSSEELVGELPMFALILTRARRPIAIGSSRSWCTLAGMIIRPRATSARIASSGRSSRAATVAICSVTRPRRAWCIWVTQALPASYDVRVGIDGSFRAASTRWPTLRGRAGASGASRAFPSLA